MASPPPSIRTAPPPSVVTPADPTHMLVERGDLKDKAGKRIQGARGEVVRVLCGRAGAPYDGVSGIRATIWASLVSCVECAKHPGVSGLRGSFADTLRDP